MSIEREIRDVIIIGGGPAGMSAALWCADLGLSCLLLEKEADLGGQLHKIHNPITNYPGLAVPTGPDMLARFSTSLTAAAFERRMNGQVLSIDSDRMALRLSRGDVLHARAFFVATGVRRRHLGIPGEEEFRGKGILESGAREAASTRGKRVAVIGGGDAALENVLLLSEHAKSVTVIHRRSEFSARSEFVAQARQRDNVEFVLDASATRIGGGERVEWAEITASAGSRRLNIDNLLIRVGVEPNTECIRGVLDLDEKGYVCVDSLGRTSQPGFFGIGDVASPVSPTISTACGMAATAAKAVFAWLNSDKRI